MVDLQINSQRVDVDSQSAAVYDPQLYTLKKHLYELCSPAKPKKAKNSLNSRMTPYVVSKPALKSSVLPNILKVGAKFNSLSEHKRYEKNTMELNQLKLQIKNNPDLSDSLCRSVSYTKFLDKYTTCDITANLLDKFRRFLSNPSSPTKPMRLVLLDGNPYIALGLTSRSQSNPRPINNSQARSLYRVNKSRAKFISSSSSRLNVDSIPKSVLPWASDYLPYNQSYRKNGLVLENVIWERRFYKYIRNR